MKYTMDLICMIISEIMIFSVLILVLNSQKGKRNHQLKVTIICIFLTIFIWNLSLILEILFQNTSIPITVFEGFASFGACFLPVLILFLGIVFGRTNIKIRWYYILFFVIPIVSTILMFTNDSHHLMYEVYSLDMQNSVHGSYFIVHSIYSYACIFIGLANLLYFSIKNSGIFSKQSLLMIVGTLIPVIINILGTFGVVNFSVYVTPISFAIGVLCYTLAIFKFDVLDVKPIALQTIVNRISDGYIVLNTEKKILTYNQTFKEMFGVGSNDISGKDFYEFMENCKITDAQISKIQKNIDKTTETVKPVTYEQHYNSINKYFQVEVTPITSGENSLGTLILLKDITQHKEDMATIKNNQDILMERERLASLGQLIGGIAHNLKTPIMSISGATEGLTDLVKELDLSIGNPVVTNDDFHDIAKDMNDWLVKIKDYTQYMSDIITAVKGQAVTLANDEITSFTVVELFKRVDILMKHELKKSVVYLNSSVQVADDVSIRGDINSLVQVINNMISNAIQSYNGETEQFIDLTAKMEGNNVIISVKDYGCGIPDKVKDKLFKEMITTKGKNGTGLGLYMSYSTIRAHFGGNITVESEKGKGTTFNVILPVSE